VRVEQVLGKVFLRSEHLTADVTGTGPDLRITPLGIDLAHLATSHSIRRGGFPFGVCGNVHGPQAGTALLTKRGIRFSS
jgi:hypothetical protein